MMMMMMMMVIKIMITMITGFDDSDRRGVWGANRPPQPDTRPSIHECHHVRRRRRSLATAEQLSQSGLQQRQLLRHLGGVVRNAF